MPKITSINGRLIYNSRGSKALEVDIVSDNQYLGRSCAPSGASVGKYEAVSFPNNQPEESLRFLDEISKKIIGYESDDLKLINRNEAVLAQAMKFIRFHIEVYNRHHKRDMNEIQQRLNQTKSAKQKKFLQEELHYQKIMLEVIAFMNKLESKEPDFIKSFNSLLFHAVNRIINNNIGEGLSYLQTAKSNLSKMGSIYRKQKDLEKYLLKNDKKLIENLKQENKNNHKT